MHPEIRDLSRDYEDALLAFRSDGDPRLQIQMHEKRKALERHPKFTESERCRAALRTDDRLAPALRSYGG